MQQHADEMAQRAFRLFVVSASAAAFDLLVEQVEHVLAEGDQRRRGGLLPFRDPEPGDGVVDDGPRLRFGVQFGDRGVQADGLEIEQFDSGQFDDVVVDVAGHAEIDDDPSDTVVERGTGDQGCFRRRAGDDDVADGKRTAQVVGRRQLVLRREPGSSAGWGEDSDVPDAAIPQGCDGRGCVTTGAHEQHAGRSPVRHSRGRELEREPHQRASGRADAGPRLHAPRGVGSLLEEPFEIGGRGSVGARRLQRPPHLSGDLGLTDDDGIQPARHGEEVLDDSIAVEDGDRRTDILRCEGARSGHRVDRGVDGASGRVVGDVEIRFEPVAGCKDDGAVEQVRTGDERLRGRGCTNAQSLQEIEAGVAIRRRETDEHALNANSGQDGSVPGGTLVRVSDPTALLDQAPAALPDDHPLVDGRTDRSALVRALRGDRPERLPVWFMRQAGRSLPEYRELRIGTAMLDACLDPAMASEITLQPVRRHGVDAAIFFSDIVVPLRLAGVDVEIVPGRGPVLGAPIRTPEAVAALPTLVPSALAPIVDAVQRTVAQLGETPLIGFAGAPFTLAAYMVEGGPSKDHMAARALMHADPETWSRLLEWAADVSGTFLRAQALAGASAVQLFDSWVGSLSRNDYVDRVKQYSAQALSAVEDLGVPRIHFGVGSGEVLGDMASVGVEAVGVDWRVPLAAAVHRMGPAITVQGNIDPALLSAPWPVLEHHVRRVIQSGAVARAHVVNLGHGVPPETDPDVLTRIVELVHSVGSGITGAAA